MGALDHKTRRRRRNRLAAELAATYHPRKHFRLGQDIGWHWQFDDPNLLYRRRNRLTYTRDFSNAVWLKSRCTAAAPAGGFTTITEDTSAAASHYWYRTAESAPVGTYGVYTLRVKKSATRNFALWVGSNASNPIDGFRRYVNLSTGGTTSPLIDGTGVVEVSTAVTEYDATTWLITCVMQIATGGTAFGILNCLVNGASLGNIFYTGDGASSIQAGYAQLETYTTTATEYQDVPTTWPQAYLDAVGAQNIYAWTDTAGTIPAVTIGDGIGLLLGREYGGARGANKVTTTDLTNAAWTSGGAFGNFAGSTVSGNTITGTGTNGSRSFRFAVSPGDTIEFTATATFVAAGGATSAGLRLSFGTSGASLIAGTVADSTGRTSGTGAVRVQGTAPATASFCEISVVAFGAAGSQATFSDMAARTIPGTHLTQATGTAKPTLSARVNMLLATEDFSSANWQKVNGGTGSAPVVTNNAATAPNGTLTADKIDFSLGAGTTPADYSITQQAVSTTGTHKGVLWIKADSPVRIMLRTGSTWLAVDATTTWQSFTPPQENSNSIQFGLRAGYGIAGLPTSASVYVWGADLRTADDAAKNIPAYQRVGATATDYDTDGFPHFALADGTDDCWASVATVDGSATDKLTVVAAVTKNSDAASGMVLETSANLSLNAGSVYLLAASGSGPNYAYASRGTVIAAGATGSTYPAPHTGVTVLVSDISADSLTLAVNGVAAATSPFDQGAGNYGNHKVNGLARDNGASFRFNGRFYGSTGRFGPMGDSERNNLTRWWMKRIGTA